MAPRNEVNSLLSISLENIERFVQGIITTVAPVIVRYHNDCVKRDRELRYNVQYSEQNIDTDVNDDGNIMGETADAESQDIFENNAVEKSQIITEEGSEKNYRVEALNEYVERLREHIFSHVPYNIVDDIKNKVSFLLNLDSPLFLSGSVKFL